MLRSLLLLFMVCLVVALAHVAAPTRADSIEQINARSLNALVFLRDRVEGAEELLRSAPGVLVFPDVVKLGFGIGGEYGEGVLLVDGQPAGYYATSGGSYGLPLGAKFKAEVLVFLSPDALEQFRSKREWQVGVDGTVVLAGRGAGAGLDPASLESDIVGFVFSNEGLLADMNVDGAKITRLAR